MKPLHFCSLKFSQMEANEFQTILQELQEVKAAALMGSKEALNMAEAAALMGITKSTLYKMVARREIPHYKSRGGKFTYFRRSDLEKYALAVRVSSIDEVEQAAIKHTLKTGQKN